MFIVIRLWKSEMALLKARKYDGAGAGVGGVGGGDNNKQFHVVFLYHDQIVND